MPSGFRILCLVVPCVLVFSAGESASAGIVTVSFADGDLAAEAVFNDNDVDVGAGRLRITLTNTSGADVLVQSSILTALFFDIAGSAQLTPVSAVLGSGSMVFFDSDGQPVAGDVGGEWAYAFNATDLGAGSSGYVDQSHGISSAGFGLFGNANFLNGPNSGPNLDGQTAVGGVNYGLTSAGDDTTTSQGGSTQVSGMFPLVKNSVVFLLSGWTGDIGSTLGAPGGLQSVRFQYGTALTESSPTVEINEFENPEPSSILLACMGGLSLFRYRRRKATAALAA